MYEDYGYKKRDSYGYDQPGPSGPPPRQGPPPERDRERGPPPPPGPGPAGDRYSPEPDYRPPPAAPPPAPAPSYAPPFSRRFKQPLKPNQIPKTISLFMILGILFMFIGLTVMTLATPTTPPPEVPSDEDDYADYMEDYSDWQREYGNDHRNRESMIQIGVVLHYLGVFLAGFSLVGGGMLLNDLDIKLRITLIITGTVLVVFMFLVPYGWMQIGTPSYS